MNNTNNENTGMEVMTTFPVNSEVVEQEYPSEYGAVPSPYTEVAEKDYMVVEKSKKYHDFMRAYFRVKFKTSITDSKKAYIGFLIDLDELCEKHNAMLTSLELNEY